MSSPTEIPKHARRWQLGALVAFLVVLLSPWPADLPDPARRCAAVTAAMGVLWMTQALPIAVTSLIPLVAFPLMAIVGARDISRAYMSNSIMLFLGGMVIALGIERWNLHRRIALHVCRAVGVGPRRIVLGFMLATAFLSMWISNTATTLLMLPIALALLSTLTELRGDAADEGEGRRFDTDMGFALLLGIAYAASIGGVTTLVGTPTNLIYTQTFSDQFPDGPAVSAGQWIVSFLPVGVVLLATAWTVLTWRLREPPSAESLDASFFTDRIRDLGKPTRAEWLMTAVFAATAGLWILRTPLDFGFGPVTFGWGDALADLLIAAGIDEGRARGAVDDSTVAITMTVLMFLIPASKDADGETNMLMDWPTARKLPWAILLLFGGAFALKNGFEASGLSQYIGGQFVGLAGLPIWVVVAVTCFALTFLTEFNQNVATCAIILPVLAAASPQLGIDPRLIMIPAAVSASCAFMLPIATAPNAIAFSSGKIDAAKMARTGLWLNLAGVVVITATTLLWLKPQLGLSATQVPDWAITAPADAASTD
ncbi:SLC13 family permease [Stratiformator vulcanicus]|uniref:Sodium-dependent dicarboxylate transporter SdcS n=1 Tax=Stratiformator vulcanicus TaxID=2527980 RepID=A0A517QZS7_9PLAN|nr:SLC13 family permease [Stratiformator vulcanicus]QDT37156.1 Sodium-dependent dicarboxylate transporter SdcS [Stratiformator vulcanicus]